MKNRLMALAAIAAIASSATMVVGCKSIARTGYIDATAPTGATLVVMPGEQIIIPGEFAELPVGEYQLETRRPGYRTGKQHLVVTEQNTTVIDAITGAGFAPVSLQVSPATATLLLDGRRLSQGAWQGELDAGEYKLEVTGDGYFPSEQSIRVQPGKPVNLRVALKPTPIRANLTLSAPAGTRLLFKGREMGVQTFTHRQLSPGSYRYTAIQPVDDLNRLTGAASFRVQKSGDFSLAITPDRKERFYQGQWYPRNRAVELEQQHYQQLKVANPVVAEIELNDNSLMTQWRNTPALAQTLQQLLRVGDRLVLSSTTGHQKWDIWKWDHQLTRDFENSVASFLANRPAPEVLHRPGNISPSLRLSGVTPEAMAFAVHQSRNPFALLDLNATQLPSGGISITRNSADGEITVLVSGSRPTITGAKWQRIGQSSLLRLGAGDQPLRMQWSKKPGRLLVISDTPVTLPTLADRELKQQQKQAVAFGADYQVSKIGRLTVTPQTASQWETFDRSGPLGDMLDLSQDEIGPHQQAGGYLRVWLLTLEDQQGKTKSQLS